jgi:amino acid adenylation domain-containing protein
MRGATERLVLPANLAEELRALGHREDATLFMTMLAAFETLLYRYTGQDDLVLGTPVANRQRVETEHLIGLLANTLVLRTRFDGDESFRQLLQRVREVTLGAYAHQDLPFEKLVEELRPERSLSHTPLFQVMFVQHNAPGGTMRFGNLKLEIMEAHNRTSKFDLTMFVEDRDEELAVWLEYTPDLFDAATIRRMLRHFQVLLEGIAASPEESLSRLPLLEPEERGQLLFEWNDTREEFDAEHILHALFEQQAERTPGHCALVFEDRSLTYAELNARANQLAHFLRSRGVRTETRVGILMERSVEMVVALLGVLKASGAYVPLDPAYPRERLAFMLQDAQALVLLTQERFAGNLPEHGAEVVRLDSGWQQLASESTENPLHTVVPDNLAYVIYTSGSTGQPKGAMNTHRGVCNRLLWGQRAYGLSESDRVLQKTPFSFDVSVWEFFWPLLSGASLVLARPGGHQDSEYLTALIRAERISTIHFVPSMLQLFLESGGFEHCPGLRRVMCSGEALPYGLQERFFARSDAELHNLYGPTEASIEVTSWECRRAGAEETVPIGRPISNAQIYLLDEQMQPVPVGVPGELHIGGTCVARGYLKRPALTAEKFIPHPFSAEPGARLYKSGDLARHLPDGNVDYLGRIDQQIKLRGFRIELGEIEGALGQHPLVRECVVLAREDEPGEKRIAAYLTTRAPQAPSTGELRAYLKERLPEYMIPSYFVMLEELPLSPNGKLDRKRLPAPGGARPELREKYEAPRNERERTLSGIWSEVLGVDQVGIHDDFFELGGHSLIATRVLSRMNQTFKAELPLRCMFDSPTVAGLAALLEQTPQEAPAAAPPSIATVSRDAHRRKLSSFIDKPFETGKSQAN